MTLLQHDKDYIMAVDGQELMTSRAHESEIELARLGCHAIAGRRNPLVLVGGLGMGFTLRQALDMLPRSGIVVVAELIPEVVRWNRELIGDLAGRPLDDGRVTVRTCDVFELVQAGVGRFDAILLDVDNGPAAMTSARNRRIYDWHGLQACRAALRQEGCLAIWSATVDHTFERRLQRAFPHVHRFRVPAYKGGKARARCVWTASFSMRSLPPLPERSEAEG